MQLEKRGPCAVLSLQLVEVQYFALLSTNLDVFVENTFVCVGLLQKQEDGKAVSFTENSPGTVGAV